MEGVVEAAGRQVSKFVVIVGEDLDNTVGPVSGLVPLGDRCSSELATLFLDDEDALADKELEGGIVADILYPLRGKGMEQVPTADERPTALNAVDKGGDVSVDRRGRLGPVVGDVERQWEVSPMFNVEGRETSARVDGGIVRDLEVRKVAGPTRVGCRDPMSEEKGVENLVEPLGEADGFVMSGGGGLETDTESGISGSDDVGYKDGSAVGADAAGEPLVAGNTVKVEVEDFLRRRGTLGGNGDDTAGELVGEDEDMIIAIVIKADAVEVHGYNIPGVVAVSSQVEGASRARRDLRSSADVTEADVLGDVCRKRRPVVETGDKAGGAVHALVAMEVMVSVHRPGAKGGRQDNAVIAGRVRRRIEEDEDTVDEAVASGSGASGGVGNGRVSIADRKEVSRAIKEVEVDVAIVGAGLLLGDNLGEGRRSR